MAIAELFRIRRKPNSCYAIIVVLALTAAFQSEQASAQCSGVNLVFNGDFESGNTGFSTGYSYRSGSIPGFDQYTITTNPRHVHPSGRSFGDHTSGSGNMMAVNGPLSDTDKTLWAQTVPVDAFSHYEFSTWVSSWTEGPTDGQALLQFSINGELLGVLRAPTSAGVWVQFRASWNSGSSTAASIRIVDINAGLHKLNDFAIDDIALCGGELPDLIATGLHWDEAGDQVAIFFEVADAPLTTDTTARLAWSATSDLADVIFLPDLSHLDLAVPEVEGLYGPFLVKRSAIGPRPRGATHLLLILDPDGRIVESDENNNTFALEWPRVAIQRVALSSGGILDDDAMLPFAGGNDWGNTNQDEIIASASMFAGEFHEIFWSVDNLSSGRAEPDSGFGEDFSFSIRDLPAQDPYRNRPAISFIIRAYLISSHGSDIDYEEQLVIQSSLGVRRQEYVDRAVKPVGTLPKVPPPGDFLPELIIVDTFAVVAANLVVDAAVRNGLDTAINSIYRSPIRNWEVYRDLPTPRPVNRSSQHMWGRAVDFAVGDYNRNGRVDRADWARLSKIVREVGFSVIDEGVADHVHIQQFRPSGDEY